MPQARQTPTPAGSCQEKTADSRYHLPFTPPISFTGSAYGHVNPVSRIVVVPAHPSVPRVGIEHLVASSAAVAKHQEAISALLMVTEGQYKSSDFQLYDYNESTIYKDLKLSDAEWQWEFTRRNEIYRRLWLVSKIGKANSIPVYKLQEDVFNMLWMSDPNVGVLDIQENAKNWKAIGSEIFPPDFDTSVKFLRDYRPTRVIYEGEPPESLKFTGELQFYFRFDPDFPIGPQIQEVKRFFASSGRKASKRASRTAWPDYLRVWDAAASGLSLAQIAPLLQKLKNEQSARDSLRAANELVRSCATVF